MSSDDFAGSGALSANWTRRHGSDTLVRSSDRVVGVAAAGDLTYAYTADAAVADQRARITFRASSGTFLHIGVAVRIQATGECYAFRCRGDGGGRALGYHNNVNGGFSAFSGCSDSGSISVNDELEIEAIGTTIRALINGVQVFSATDATLASGQYGMHWRNGAAGLQGDDWLGEEIAGDEPTISDVTTDAGAESIEIGCTTDTDSGDLYIVMSPVEADITGITAAQIEAGNYQDDTAADFADSVAVSDFSPTISLTSLFPPIQPGSTLYGAISQDGSNVLTFEVTTLASSIPGAGYIKIGTPAADPDTRISGISADDIVASGITIVGDYIPVVNDDGTWDMPSDGIGFPVQIWNGSSWSAIDYEFAADTDADTISNQSITGVGLSDVVEFVAFEIEGADVVQIYADGGEYRIDDGGGFGSWTSDDGLAFEGDLVQVRHTSSASYNTPVVTTLTIGDDDNDTQDVTFTSVTAPALAFTSQPTAQNLGQTSVRVQFTAAGHNPITYGVAVIPDGDPVPSAADILAGTVSGAVAELTGQSAANGVVELSDLLSALTADTPYDIYVAVDDAESAAVRSNRVDITTDEESSFDPDPTWPNQGNQQAAFRALSLTEYDYNGDFIAAMRVDLADDSGDINGLIIRWLQQRLGSSNQSLMGLKAEAAADRGVSRWQEILNPLDIGT